MLSEHTGEGYFCVLWMFCICFIVCVNFVIWNCASHNRFDSSSLIYKLREEGMGVERRDCSWGLWSSLCVGISDLQIETG